MEIVWRRIAVDDLDEAHRYIAKDNPAAANRIRNAIIAAVERLKDNANSGRPGRVDETRELVVPRTPYIVAYAVLHNQLMILSVLHGAREGPERL
jgi:toxin ParE1/3/4